MNGGACGGCTNKRSAASHLCGSAAGRGGWARWARPRLTESTAPPQKAPTQATVTKPAAVASSLEPPGTCNDNIVRKPTARLSKASRVNELINCFTNRRRREG